MQTQVETRQSDSHLHRIATLLRISGGLSFIVQAALAAVTGVMLLLAVSGRTFNQAMTPSFGGAPGVPRVAVENTTPGVGVGIFCAIGGMLTLLFGIYLAFRLVRFSKRLRNPNPEIHPNRGKVMEVLRLAVITGLAGMLITIVGTGAAIGVLLAKSVAQPQGVAIYDPSRIIRSLDVFVAASNTVGLTGHFFGAVAALGVFNWLHHPSDPDLFDINSI